MLISLSGKQFGINEWRREYLPKSRFIQVVLRCLFALAMGLLAYTQADAKNVLVLSTYNSYGASPNSATDSMDNLVTEFTSAGDTVTHIKTLDQAGAVSAATFSSSAYDLVVVARLVAPFETGNLSAINQAIANRSANGFALLYDTGGAASGGAAADLLAELKLAANIDAVASAPVITDVNFQLNTSNAPSIVSSFSGLNPLRGGYMFYMNNVPAANVLYLPPSEPLPATGTMVNNVAAVFIPSTQSFGGSGACLFAMSDISMFESRNYFGGTSSGVTNNSGVTNQGKIASAFSAALSSGGGCGIPASIAKTFSPTSVNVGQTSTLTISVGNTGTTPISGLTVTDNLPAPLQVGGAATTTCTGGTLAAPMGGSSVSLSGSAVPGGGCSITVPVIWPVSAASQCTTTGSGVTNTITPGTDFSVTGAGYVKTPATATLACPAVPDLAVSVTAAPNPVTAGSTATYTITVINQGGAAADLSSLSTVLPAGATVVSTSTPCAGGFACSLGTLTTGQTVTVNVIVQIPATAQAGSSYALTANASTATIEPVTTNNSATASVSVVAASLPDLVVSASALPATVTPDSNATYTITVTNQGSAAADSVSLNSILPAGTTLVSTSAPCSGLACSLGSMAVGQSITVTVVVHIPASAAAGSTYPLVATASTVTTESNLANNSASASVTAIAVTPSQPAPVPSLGQWALMLVSLALAGLAAVRLRRA